MDLVLEFPQSKDDLEQEGEGKEEKENTHGSQLWVQPLFTLHKETFPYMSLPAVCYDDTPPHLTSIQPRGSNSNFLRTEDINSHQRSGFSICKL